MATNAQIIANQANAQNSTGPRTIEGKQKSSQNARKLGMFNSDITLKQEERQEFAETIAAYYADYNPRPGVETQLVTQLALATIRQNRLARMEAGLLYNENPGHTRHEATMIMTETYWVHQVD